MEEKIKKIKDEAINSINSVNELKILDDIRVKYLGKKGELTSILRGMGALSKEERPIIGSLVNEVRDTIENLICKKEKELKRNILEESIKKEVIDVTEPSKKESIGSVHPITKVIDEVSMILVIGKIMPLIDKYSLNEKNVIDQDLKSILIEYAISVVKEENFAEKLAK